VFETILYVSFFILYIFSSPTRISLNYHDLSRVVFDLDVRIAVQEHFGSHSLGLDFPVLVGSSAGRTCSNMLQE
jgi:hypothetical protein